MPYLIYASTAAAERRSEAEATARGCSGVTTHWWDVVEGPDDAAVIVTDAADPPRSGGKAPVSDPPEWYAATQQAPELVQEKDGASAR